MVAGPVPLGRALSQVSSLRTSTGHDGGHGFQDGRQVEPCPRLDGVQSSMIALVGHVEERQSTRKMRSFQGVDAANSLGSSLRVELKETTVPVSTPAGLRSSSRSASPLLIGGSSPVAVRIGRSSLWTTSAIKRRKTGRRFHLGRSRRISSTGTLIVKPQAAAECIREHFLGQAAAEQFFCRGGSFSVPRVPGTSGRREALPEGSMANDSILALP